MDIGERILILASSSTGNNVFCTPAIRLIRKHRPHALIGVVALSALSAEVFEDNPDINHLYVTDKDEDFDAIAKRYTTVIALNTNAVNKKLKNVRSQLLVAPDFVEGKARADQLLAYVAGILQVKVVEEDRRYVMGVATPDTILDTWNIPQNAVLVHIHLGLGRTALHGWKFFYRSRANNDVRLWHIDNYVALGKMLRESSPNIRIVITGTKNEAYLAKEFVKALPDTINLIGKTSAADIYNMMRRISLFIAHDCGVFHIASASDVPIVGLYAPTDPVLAGPYPPGPQHRVIKKNLMSDIQPSEVFAQAQELLQLYANK